MMPSIGRRVHYTSIVYGERAEVDLVALERNRQARAKKQEDARAAARCLALPRAELDEALRLLDEEASKDEETETLALCGALPSSPVVKAAVIVGCTPRSEGAGENESDWIVDLEMLPEHVVFSDVPFSSEPLRPLHWNWPV